MNQPRASAHPDQRKSERTDDMTEQMVCEQRMANPLEAGLTGGSQPRGLSSEERVGWETYSQRNGSSIEDSWMRGLPGEGDVGDEAVVPSRRIAAVEENIQRLPHSLKSYRTYRHSQQARGVVFHAKTPLLHPQSEFSEC